jgi:serine/threonine protein kinase
LVKDKIQPSFESRYKILKEAGKGAFGSVYKAEDTTLSNLSLLDHRRYVAIKKLFYDRRYEQRELSTLDEIKKRKLCRNIIELKDRYFQNIEEQDERG